MEPALITVRLATPLREFSSGSASVRVPGESMRAVLAQLESRHPALYQSVCDETGSVRRHIGLFVNSAHVQDRGGLDTALSPGDVVSIFTAVSGG